MGILDTKNAFLNTFHSTTKEVKLPGTKDSVVVRGLTTGELIEAAQREDESVQSGRDGFDYMVDTVIKCLVKPAVTVEDRGDVIRMIPFTVVQHIFREILDFSGMTVEASDQTAKNFVGQNGEMQQDLRLPSDSRTSASSGSS